MILKADEIVNEIESSQDSGDPFVITPQPDVEKLKKSGSASIDLRLGSWFLMLRQARVPVFDIYKGESDIPSESKLTKSHYVPFGESYILHPKAFVLGITLEWIRLPKKFAGYVVGRSSWGRHGLIIATATGVHPGFTGCLTLELSNVGEIPITIKPGTTICQLFIHDVKTTVPEKLDISQFIGRRKPILGAIILDEVALKLAKG
ncbi:dCTP deaminase, dUMP-forming [subsurface metagenome]